jgi:hypothetical protein
LKTEIDADQDLKHDFHVLLWIDPDLLSQNSENFKSLPFKQCFGSGSGLDPDSIRSVDPDPGGQKSPTKVEQKNEISCFAMLDALF